MTFTFSFWITCLNAMTFRDSNTRLIADRARVAESIKSDVASWMRVRHTSSTLPCSSMICTILMLSDIICSSSLLRSMLFSRLRRSERAWLLQQMRGWRPWKMRRKVFHYHTLPLLTFNCCFKRDWWLESLRKNEFDLIWFVDWDECLLLSLYDMLLWVRILIAPFSHTLHL